MTDGAGSYKSCAWSSIDRYNKRSGAEPSTLHNYALTPSLPELHSPLLHVTVCCKHSWLWLNPVSG
jgi:hypothetical protein